MNYCNAFVFIARAGDFVVSFFPFFFYKMNIQDLSDGNDNREVVSF